MKSIKSFKYKDSSKFEEFVAAYGYKLEDVKGFSLVEKKQYLGNVLTEYFIHFQDGEYECFREVIFKDFNEYHQARLGFKGSKLEEWFQDANIREYKKNMY